VGDGGCRGGRRRDEKEMLACGPIDGVLTAMPKHRVDGGDDE
jgi:hypothetical protein